MISTQEQYEISPVKLWSPLQRQLAACGQIKGSPQQWSGIIRNLRNKGVSAVEIEWSGVLCELGDHMASGSVFNELVALASALEGKTERDHDRHPRLVMHVDELIDYLRDKPPCELVLQRCVSNEYVPQVRYEKQSRPPVFPPVVVLNGRRMVRMLQYLDRTFGICIHLHVEVDDGLFGRLRYWLLSVPRGAKKLAMHPVERRFASGQEALAYGRALVGRMARRLSQEGFVGPTKALNHFTRYSLPGGENYTEWLITAPNLTDQYWGEHFDLPNIIVHVRTTERTSTLGSKLLLMEEIQSDWNQALRDVIRRPPRREQAEGEDDMEWDEDVEIPPDNPYLKHWLDAALRMMLLLAAHRGYAGIAWLPGKLHAERFPWANAEGLTTFYDQIVPSAVEKLGKSWNAQAGAAQFATMSRRYRVQKVTKKTTWRVMHRETGEWMDEEFTNADVAEKFCQSLEVPVMESVGVFLLSDDMRADLLVNGLPCLGAIGKRTDAVPQPHPMR